MAFFSASSAALAALTLIRKAALVDSLAGAAAVLMLRYLSNPAVIETDWLVLRGLGVSATAVLLARTLDWMHPVFVTAPVITVYGVCAEMLERSGSTALGGSAPHSCWCCSVPSS